MTEGPSAPRLLTNAIPPAAVFLDRYSLTVVKNNGVCDNFPTDMTQRPTNDHARLPREKMVMRMPTAPRPDEMKKCQRRSTLRSELRPSMIMPTIPKTEGMVVSRPMVNTSGTTQLLISIGVQKFMP